MSLTLDRYERLSHYEGWRAFAETPPIERPEPLTLRQLANLGEDAREQYNLHREAYHSSFLIKTNQVMRLHTLLWDVLDANQQGPDRVKGAAVIDAWPGVGKSTAANAFGRDFHRQQIRRYGSRFDDDQTQHIPVCRVGFAGTMTSRALNEAILNFFNHPAAGASDTRGLRNRNVATLAAEAVRRHGTRLIIVDDVHFLKIHTNEGIALANELKWLANEYPATFLFTGVNMRDTGLLTEGKEDKDAPMSQTARRWTLLPLSPFDAPIGAGRQSWRELVATIESRLVLANAEPNTLRKQADYLYARSTGMIGSLFDLITRSCARAIRTGEERLSRELIDDIEIDAAAEGARDTIAAELKVKRTAAGEKATAAISMTVEQ